MSQMGATGGIPTQTTATKLICGIVRIVIGVMEQKMCPHTNENGSWSVASERDGELSEKLNEIFREFKNEEA
jgi:hypothetical protein